MCYDAGHGWLFEETPFALLQKYRSRVMCLHLSDNDGNIDMHWNIGDGVVDWRSFVESYPYAEFNGPLSAEPYINEPTGPEEEYLETVLASLKMLATRIEETHYTST